MIIAAWTLPETRPTHQALQPLHPQGWGHPPWVPSLPSAPSARYAAAHTPTPRFYSVFILSASAVWKRFRITGIKYRVPNVMLIHPWGPPESVVCCVTSVWPGWLRPRWPVPSISSLLHVPAARVESPVLWLDVWPVLISSAQAVSWLNRFVQFLSLFLCLHGPPHWV